MSQLAKIFELSVYGLLVLAALILGHADGEPFPYLVTLPLAAAALVFTERLKLFRLKAWMANVLGVLAFLRAATEFFGPSVDAKLMAGAHLVVYISWILLFQEKQAAQYWWMCALSVLHVAVGSVLTNSPTFGILLTGYVFAALWTLSVFSLYQAALRFRDHEEVARGGPAGAGNGPRAEDGAGVGRGTGGARTDGFGTRGLEVYRRPSTTRSAIQRDPNERYLSARFVLATAWWSCLALGIAAAFFTGIPRVWVRGDVLESDFADRGFGGRSVSGFSSQVQLGEIGDILESTQPVMEVSFKDADTGKALAAPTVAARLGQNELLFRGAVLAHYDRGRWSVGQESVASLAQPARYAKGSVIQEYRLEPIDTDVLFALHPVEDAGVRIAADEEELEPALLVEENSVLLRPGRRGSVAGNRRAISYTVVARPAGPGGAAVSEARRDPRQDENRVAGNDTRRPANRRQIDHLPYRQPPPANLARLTALARDVAGMDAEGPPPSEAERARRIERHLAETGGFAYSVKMTVRDPEIDPVEDFLFNRRSGHCEYFASALALMLRAVDVPARIVNGFKGGEVNRFSGRLDVQQRHAHSWVEAYVDDRWIVLDGTPAVAHDESVESLVPEPGTWLYWEHVMAQAWNRYVVNVNMGTQREELYDPVQKSLESWWDAFEKGEEDAEGVVGSVKAFLADPSSWFSWRSGSVAFLLCGAIGLGVWLIRTGRWDVRGFLDRMLRRSAVEQGPRIDFYERFATLCAGQGLVRGPTQTQREFSDQVADVLGGRIPAAAAHLGRDVTEAFYEVRFGGRTLAPDRTRAIAVHLEALESALGGKS